MARAAVRRRLNAPLPWAAARLVDARLETPTARTLVLHVPDWPGHLPGQHVDVRLTAEDSYSARRSYSIASAPDCDRIELTVQLLPDGEVSSFLVHDFAVGDPVELRGPLGGWFVWDPDDHRPVLLVGGGSGRRTPDGDASHATQNQQQGELPPGLLGAHTCGCVLPQRAGLATALAVALRARLSARS